ncbi:MAG TPA: TetR/AcrR family transcriptional regulator [Anaerolineaceae bacterium]|nr:TetR/AcrR family transcriptional regulator [Anaerolineaceae bacterium]HPN51181.1 TetR/AcrR family transcriptional regulator [Anaerolineaceae bacterium]
MSPRSKEMSEEMRLRSRGILLAAARKCFAETGYFQVHIADIARAAGMSQGNIYWYFSSKEDLLRAVMSEAFETLGQVMARAAAGEGNARQKLEALLDGLLDYARSGREFTAIMISLMGHSNEDMFARLGINMEQVGWGYTQSLLAILTQGQTEGVIPAELDPLALTMMFFGMFNGMNLVYGQQWLALPPETLKAGMRRLFGMTEG